MPEAVGEGFDRAGQALGAGADATAVLVVEAQGRLAVCFEDLGQMPKTTAGGLAAVHQQHQALGGIEIDGRVRKIVAIVETLDSELRSIAGVNPDALP